MTDEIIDKAWSYIGPPDTIRWTTPRFVKYGRVLVVHKRSMRVQFFDEPDERAIPDAKWYHLQFKMYGPTAEEHLCVVKYRPLMRGRMIPVEPEDDRLGVAQACELVPMDPKQLRRHIRRGTIIAVKDRNEQWQISRSHLMEVAAKYGWV